MATEVSFIVKVFQFVAVVLLTAFFCFQAYDIYANKDRWASTFYSNYGIFESWWNKQFKRTLMKELAYDMPDQKVLFPYKAKSAIFFGYFCAFGSLLLWTGEKFSSLILLVPAIVHGAIVHGPMQAKTQTTFGRAEQAWVIDVAIIAALIAVTGGALSITSSKKQQVAEKRAF